MLRKVYSEVGFACNTVEGVLKFFLMNVDRHVRAAEIVEAASVIEMKVPHDYSLDIGDFMASLRNLRLKLLFRVVIGLGEDVVQRGSPALRVVFAASCLKQNQALGWMLNEG